MKRIHPLWWVLLVFIVALLITSCTNGITGPGPVCSTVPVVPHSGTDTLHVVICIEVTP